VSGLPPSESFETAPGRKTCSHVADSLPARSSVIYALPFREAVPLVGIPGGFSGGLASACRRPVPARLAGIRPHSRPPCCHHRLMSQARAGSGVRPTVLRTSDHHSTFSTPGACGTSPPDARSRDFHTHPTAARLDAALHYPWPACMPHLAQTPCPVGPCPAVIRRLVCTREWLDLVASVGDPRSSLRTRSARRPRAPGASSNNCSRCCPSS